MEIFEFVDMRHLSENLSAFTLLIFCLRTALLIVGVWLFCHGLALLWELRPVRRKKFKTVVDAKVTELTEERHSASMNIYYMPRFEYEQDGELKAFSPAKAYRPCRLKLNGDVKLCLSDDRKFRAVRKDITVKRALLFIAVGAALAILQLIF